MTKMTEEERRLYDVRADHEAWNLAHKILEPWVRVCQHIGSEELSRVMENALAEVEAELNRTLDVLEPLKEGSRVEQSNALIDLVEELALSRNIPSVEHLVELANDAGYRLTVGELRRGPWGGFGAALDSVLHLNEEEKKRLVRVFSGTFLSSGRIVAQEERRVRIR